MSDMDERVKTFFDDAAGPAEAQPLPRRRIGARRAVVALCAVAIVVVAAVFAVVSRHGGSKSSGAQGSGSCIASITWRGHVYIGNRVGAAPELGSPVEGATKPPCESNAQPTAARVTTLARIDPRTALGSAEDPTIVWIVAGRCAGFAQAVLHSCLRESLAFEGRHYVPTRLERSLDLGGSIGAGELARGNVRQTVAVRSLAGVSKAAAVATEEDPKLVFLADGRCELPGLGDLSSCLRSS
jgi:hypothetical protein